jgi:hypothetical protein
MAAASSPASSPRFLNHAQPITPGAEKVGAPLPFNPLALTAAAGTLSPSDEIQAATEFHLILE